MSQYQLVNQSINLNGQMYKCPIPFFCGGEGVAGPPPPLGIDADASELLEASNIYSDSVESEYIFETYV